MGHEVGRVCTAYESTSHAKTNLVRVTEEKVLRWRSSCNCQDNRNRGFTGNIV